MQPSESTGPVVVGIDGSSAAMQAAVWAAEEAISRDVCLRLVHVVDVEDDVDRDLDENPAEIAGDWPETELGREALRAASAVVRATGKPVHTETQILWGAVDETLITESKTAAMLCVGSTGITPVCHRMVGSTAAIVAERAQCPVAIIRTPHAPAPNEPDWIVVVVDDSPQSDTVVEHALTEAQLRRAPILALGVSHGRQHSVHYDELERRVATWRSEHPYVHVYPVSVPHDAASFLAQHDELSVQLTVLGARDAETVPTIVGPHRLNRSAPQRCSVLVVR
ncbi:universal stress protein [Mycolicibacterium sp. 050158]|jgi:nucleotide-binding universal stress UspA family protein|uniref:universal stress protein n=1 Tax=Mycolicibacterium sp. 050158 TaxID=3090602 RepID=UPI00299EC23F|nr:universal stress protein [Mycolicibacterium sp. 050158]MDX1890808.1 universal stress protein [Mycolicibacterium sp. 050158]